MYVLIYNLLDIKIFASEGIFLNKKEKEGYRTNFFLVSSCKIPLFFIRSYRFSVRLLVFFLFSLAYLSLWQFYQGNWRE
jgi:hypothetical protein